MRWSWNFPWTNSLEVLSALANVLHWIVLMKICFLYLLTAGKPRSLEVANRSGATPGGSEHKSSKIYDLEVKIGVYFGWFSLLFIMFVGLHFDMVYLLLIGVLCSAWKGYEQPEQPFCSWNSGNAWEAMGEGVGWYQERSRQSCVWQSVALSSALG